MGKITDKVFDFLFLSGDWEKYRRVKLYREIGEAAKTLSKEQLIELQKVMNKINSKVAK
jgi:hypothetical protein